MDTVEMIRNIQTNQKEFDNSTLQLKNKPSKSLNSIDITR